MKKRQKKEMNEQIKRREIEKKNRDEDSTVISMYLHCVNSDKKSYLIMDLLCIDCAITLYIYILLQNDKVKKKKKKFKCMQNNT